MDSAHYQIMWGLFCEAGKDIIFPIHETAAFLNPSILLAQKFKEADLQFNWIKQLISNLIFLSDDKEKTCTSQLIQYQSMDPTLFTDSAIERQNYPIPEFGGRNGGIALLKCRSKRFEY